MARPPRVGVSGSRKAMSACERWGHARTLSDQLLSSDPIAVSMPPWPVRLVSCGPTVFSARRGPVPLQVLVPAFEITQQVHRIDLSPLAAVAFEMGDLQVCRLVSAAIAEGNAMIDLPLRRDYRLTTQRT